MLSVTLCFKKISSGNFVGRESGFFVLSNAVLVLLLVLSYSKRSSKAIQPISLQITASRFDQPSAWQQFKQPSSSRLVSVRLIALEKPKACFKLPTSNFLNSPNENPACLALGRVSHMCKGFAGRIGAFSDSDRAAWVDRLGVEYREELLVFECQKACDDLDGA